MPQLIHHLTHPGDVAASAVLCGAPDASQGTWDRVLVTCDACLGLRAPCTCSPSTPTCPACHAFRQGGRSAGRPRLAPELQTLRSEKAFQEALRQAALAAGWLYFHPQISLQSAPGYPDLTVVRGERLIFAELKMPGKTPTAAQQRWLDALGSVEHVATHLWYPADLAQALEVLR